MKAASSIFADMHILLLIYVIVIYIFFTPKFPATKVFNNIIENAMQVVKELLKNCLESS